MRQPDALAENIPLVARKKNMMTAHISTPQTRQTRDRMINGSTSIYCVEIHPSRNYPPPRTRITWQSTSALCVWDEEGHTIQMKLSLGRLVGRSAGGATVILNHDKNFSKDFRQNVHFRDVISCHVENRTGKKCECSKTFPSRTTISTISRFGSCRGKKVKSNLYVRIYDNDHDVLVTFTLLTE